MSITLQELKSLLSEEKISKIGMQEVIESVISGKTFQEMLDLPDDVMQTFYEIAMDYFDNFQYQEAADCLLFLIALNPLESNLWIRLGNAEQTLNHHEPALEAYSMAMLANADDPFPHYYSAEVYLELGSLSQAKNCIHVCEHLIEENEEYLPLKQLLKRLT